MGRAHTQLCIPTPPRHSSATKDAYAVVHIQMRQSHCAATRPPSAGHVPVIDTLRGGHDIDWGAGQLPLQLGSLLLDGARSLMWTYPAGPSEDAHACTHANTDHT